MNLCSIANPPLSLPQHACSLIFDHLQLLYSQQVQEHLLVLLFTASGNASVEGFPDFEDMLDDLISGPSLYIIVTKDGIDSYHCCHSRGKYVHRILDSIWYIKIWSFTMLTGASVDKWDQDFPEGHDSNLQMFLSSHYREGEREKLLSQVMWFHKLLLLLISTFIFNIKCTIRWGPSPSWRWMGRSLGPMINTKYTLGLRSMD